MIVDYTKVKHIYLVCGKTDMRKSIDGLAALVQNQFDMDVFDDCLFLFCGGGRNKYKALHWDGDGFILLYEYCEQIEPPVRMIEPASAINRATQCNRESH